MEELESTATTVVDSWETFLDSATDLVGWDGWIDGISVKRVSEQPVPLQTVRVLVA